MYAGNVLKEVHALLKKCFPLLQKYTPKQPIAAGNDIAAIECTSVKYRTATLTLHAQCY